MKGEGENQRNGKSETQTHDNEWTREAKGDSHREEWLFQSVCIMPQTNLPIWRKQGKNVCSITLLFLFNVTQVFAYSKIIFIVLRVRAHHLPNISPCFPFIGICLTQSVLKCLSSRHICPHPSFSSMFNHKYPLPGFSTGLNQNIWILISWPLEDKQKIKIVLNSPSLH